MNATFLFLRLLYSDRYSYLEFSSFQNCVKYLALTKFSEVNVRYKFKLEKKLCVNLWQQVRCIKFYYHKPSWLGFYDNV